jgi:transglutaminase-like putative cysteine protease
MRLTVDHRTTYRFSVPQGRLTQLLRLTPAGTDGQAIAGWGIHVDCDARMRHGRDGFGNRTTMLYVEGPIASIEIDVSGEVLTHGSGGVLHGTTETLPPALFLRSTPLTEGGTALAAFAMEAVGSSGDPIERLHRLNGALHARFKPDRGRPIIGLAAAEAFRRETATSRDLAQMFVAGARGLGIPARYVSGYSAVCFEAVSHPAPHGWAEAHVPGLGWVAFDPCTGLSADEAYVRVAVALDSAGAAPVAGSRLGDGDEELDVDVHVERANSQD